MMTSRLRSARRVKHKWIKLWIFIIACAIIGQFVVHKEALADYTGPTGFIFSTTTNGFGQPDVRVDCLVGGGAINSRRVEDDALGSAIACPTVFNMQENISANGFATTTIGLQDGTYCIFINGGDQNTCTFGEFVYLNGEINPDGNPDFVFESDLVFSPQTEYISIISPTYGTTTASTTFDIEISFATPPSIDFRPETVRTVTIKDAVTLQEEYRTETTIASNTAESFTFSTTTTLVAGSKIIEAGYYTTEGFLYSELADTFFHVATNTYILFTGLESPQDNPYDLSQFQDCATFDVGCQFQSALIFLFYPPDGKLDRFANLWQSLRTKVPFGYVTLTIDELDNLNADGTAAFSLGTIPFTDSIFTPFKTLLSGILWAVFFMYWYNNRLKKLDI